MTRCLGMVLLLWLWGVDAGLKAEKVELAVVARGVEIDAGKMGKFVIEPPRFTLPGDQYLKPEFKVSKNKGEASYSNGVVFEFEVKGDEILCSYKDLPREGGGTFKFFMDIPLSFNEGGKFRLGGKEFRDFPKEVETEQFIVLGDNSDFILVDADGRGLEFSLKTNWFGLQDNRLYKTNTYSYQFLVDPKAVSGNDFKIKISPFKP